MKTRKVQISKARKMARNANILRAWERIHNWGDGIALIRAPHIGACCNKYTNQFLQVDPLKIWLESNVNFDGWERREEEILRRGF